jgi:hypothetical protein
VILVDVDGTLAGKYRGDHRPLRPGALLAVKSLAEVAPVYLWSVAGRENPERLMREYPELRPHVAGTFGKIDFPLDRFDRMYCIDDEEIDEAVLACERVIVSTYDEGNEDDGLLAKAAELIVTAILSSTSQGDPGNSE